MKPSCLLAVFALTVLLTGPAPADDSLVLQTRARVENPDEPGQFKIVYDKVQWDPKKTAVVICDMWNEHWCKGATGRVGEMAPRMNEVIKAAREKGVLIIHAPSGTLDTYKDTPQRKLAQSAPKVEPKVALRGWCHLDKNHESALPIDDSDGGCDCQPRCPSGHPWKSQIDTLEIAPGDAITDSAEAYYLLRQRGIENLIVMGVHTNMCVLGRPFSIRQMVYQDVNVVLMRDMTDSMYNSRKRPLVPHVRGTELVVEHIEKHWCPTITSTEFLGGPAFRFKQDDRPHVAFIVSDDHYHADKTLPVFAQMLRDRYGCYCSVLHGQGTSDIPATDELEEADVVVVFVRRLALPKEQLDKLRKYLDAGRPLVALRTASHAFDIHGDTPAGCDQWPEFDAAVLGGNYHGHGPNTAGTDVTIVAEDHPILAGVDPKPWHSTGSLYNTAPISPDATLLMTGAQGDTTEPLTWIRQHKGGRVFYSGLGHPADFQQPQFRRLLLNAVFWAMEKEVPKPRGEKKAD